MIAANCANHVSCSITFYYLACVDVAVTSVSLYHLLCPTETAIVSVHHHAVAIYLCLEVTIVGIVIVVT